MKNFPNCCLGFSKELLVMNFNLNIYVIITLSVQNVFFTIASGLAEVALYIVFVVVRLQVKELYTHVFCVY